MEIDMSGEEMMPTEESGVPIGCAARLRFIHDTAEEISKLPWERPPSHTPWRV